MAFEQWLEIKNLLAALSKAAGFLNFELFMKNDFEFQ